MNISSPALLGALRALGVVIIISVLGWIGNATNLQGIFSPQVCTVVAMIALAIEHAFASSGTSALFGMVSTHPKASASV